MFSWMNLGRAFAELQMGAELYCLHKNKWWQTSRGPLLDAGAFVAGLEYATGVDATVLGKPSPAYFAAALDALGAEPELTWMVTDDVDADVRGAQSFGMRTALVRTGKFRPETLEDSGIVPEIVLSSVAQLPDWLERSLCDARQDRHRPDRDRPDHPGARAARLPGPLLHEGRAGLLRDPPQPGRELRGAVLRQGGGRQGARLRCAVHVEGHRDRRPAEAGRDAHRSHRGLRRAGRHARDRRLADPLPHDGGRRLRRALELDP